MNSLQKRVERLENPNGGKFNLYSWLVGACEWHEVDPRYVREYQSLIEQDDQEERRS